MTFRVAISYVNEDDDAIIRKEDILTNDVTPPSDSGYFWLGPVDAEPGEIVEVEHVEGRFVKLANERDKFDKYDKLYSYIKWNKSMPENRQKSRGEIYSTIYDSDKRPYSTTGPTDWKNKQNSERKRSEVAERAEAAAETNITIDDKSDREDINDGSTDSQELVEKRQRAEEAADESPEKDITKNVGSNYSRAPAIKDYAKARADGVCEYCEKPAPFKTDGGEPYLEAHHVDELGEGGEDHPDKVVALCPSCHKEIHYGQRGDKINQSLREKLENGLAEVGK